MIRKVIEKIPARRSAGVEIKRLKVRGMFCCFAFLIFNFSFLISPKVFAGGKGTSGAQFLKIGIGARAVAMGEAYAGMEGDMNSIYWNPAGLSRIGTSRTSFSHTAWFQDIKYENLMAGYPAGSGFMALGINWLTIGSIDKYKNSGPTPTGESYSPVDMSAVISYSREVKGIPFGANLKYISSNIDGENAAGIALDIGAMYRLGKLNTGLAVQNLGTGLKFRKESDPLPLNIKLGSVYKFGRRLTTALDFNIPNDSDFRLNTGVEYSREYGKDITVALRTGYKTNTKGLDAIDGISFGFGISYKNSLLDYAWVPYGDLGTTHRLSFVYRMGAGERKEELLPPGKAKKIKAEPEKIEETPIDELDEEIKRLEQELFKKEPEKKSEKKKKKEKEEVPPLLKGGKGDLKEKKEIKKKPEIPMEDIEDLDEEIKRLEQGLLKEDEPEKQEEEKNINKKDMEEKKIDEKKVAEKKKEKKKKSLSPEETKKLMGKHFNNATQLYKQEKYKKAIAEWEEVLKLDPNHKLSKEKIEKAKEKLKK
ncbi:MAG: PorV/PorQ family protein [bacterium]